MEKYEMEDVKIGSWESRLPSDICMNKRIFDEVFSINTWNNVLTSEQKQRLIKMLPKEVSASEEVLNQTVQEFFDGSLTSFSQNPKDSFFVQLQGGQFDPEVTEVKANIKKELKKESLRQLKNYHHKLLEDIVVSRERFLTKLRGGKAKKAPKRGRKPPRGGVLQCVSSELNAKNTIGKAQDGSSLAQNSEIIPAKTEENGTATGKKRKGRGDAGEDVVDSGKPKRAQRSRTKAAAALVKAEPELPVKTETQKGADDSLSFTSKSGTVGLCSQSNLFSESILGAALTSDISSLKRASATYSSPSKSSPILASQLQASPQVSVKLEDGLGLFSNEPETAGSGCITLNYQKIDEKAGDDHTGADEFEAIQPTIGLLSSPSVTGGILSPTKTILSSPGSSGPTISISSTNTVPTVSTSLTSSHIPDRLIRVQQSDGSSNFVAVSMSNPGGTGSPVYFLSTKNLGGDASSQQQGRIIQIGKDALKTIPLTGHQLAMLGGQKILLRGTPGVTDIHSQLQKATATVTQGQAPIHTQAQEIIKIAGSGLLGTKNPTGGVHYVTNSGKGLILHPVTSSTVTQADSKVGTSVSHLVNTPTSFAGLNIGSVEGSRIQLVTSQSQPQQAKLNDSLSSLESNLLEHDELNLSLGSLGSMGLGMGMNVSGISNMSTGSLDGIMDGDGMKLEIDSMDKIDDLSVLDVNPFDSIPNLSDELDGLDLDLVDGLCDFEGLLSEEKKYPSFFSLIRDVLCSTRDHRMNFLCLEKTIRKWASSPAAAMNAWYLKVTDWNCALLTALNFLAGTYQDVHPEDFVPYIEYKYKTKYYQWIGAGRDSDNNLTPLCAIWMDNMDRLPTVKKADGETEDQEEEDDENEDSETAGEDLKKKNKRPVTPPPPRFVTDWTVRPSTEEEKAVFRVQERQRFDNPHKAFTYTMHGYESVVGPVKGVYSSQIGMTNKARGHSLLVDDRPPYVTILALVRDAVARLPNGEGTRSEICEMLRDSAFLAPDASSVTLNSVVSGALDRLHYERDPCVRYDSHKKSWIYLHRDRTQEQFERLHHNRSYTKSTKSRNNTSRKSRRPAAKGGTASSTVTSELSMSNPATASSSPASVTATSINSVSSEGHGVYHSADPSPNPSTTNATTLPLSGTTVAELLQSTIVSTPEPSASGSSVEFKLQSDREHIFNPTNIQTVKLTAVSSQPAETPHSPVKTYPPAENVLSSTQFLVQTSVPSIPVSSTNNTITVAVPTSASAQPQSTPVRIQAFTSKPVGSSGDVSSPLQIATSTSVTGSNPVTVGNPAVLRIANAVRLPLRLTGTPVGGSLRGVAQPQHRILLTRGPMTPGQGQGILLGQTSTGQTVILSANPSALSGFHAITSMSPMQVSGSSQFHFQTQGMTVVASSGATTSTSGSQMATYTLRPMVTKSVASSLPSTLLSASRPNSTTATSTQPGTVTVGNSVMDLNSPHKMIQLSLSGGSNFLKPTILTATSQGGTQTVQSTASHQTSITSTSSVQLATGGAILQGSPQRHPMGYTITTVQRGNSLPLHTVTGGQLGQLSGQGPRPVTSTAFQLQSVGQSGSENSESGSMTLTQNATPIIIRSMQGDLMLPGHIALGKGGIKLIPFPVGNNKAMLAKIIPPSSSATLVPGTSRSISLTTSDIPIPTVAPSQTSSTSTTSQPQQQP